MTDLPARRYLAADRPTALAWSRLREPALWSLAVAAVIWLIIILLAEPFGRPWGTGQEAISYWAPHIDAPYAQSNWTTTGAYVYSPAFLQLMAPLTNLPWIWFMALWTGLLLAAVRFLTGPRLFMVGALLAIVELAGGNISLLLASAMVIGFRWPAAWAFVLLTKVTPGVGLLWFAVRREWRQLGIALGVTALIIVASVATLPHAWSEWLAVLVNIAGRDGTWAAVPIPLLVRLPFAIALIVWGALTNRRWTVPVGSMLALPALWYGGLTMLLAVIALRDPERTEAALAPSTERAR